jgi:hypothetical protein
MLTLERSGIRNELACIGSFESEGLPSPPPTPIFFYRAPFLLCCCVRVMQVKLVELAMVPNPNFAICFVLDKTSMFKVVGGPCFRRTDGPFFLKKRTS